MRGGCLDNRVVDVSALAGLERLEVVRLDGNDIEDIRAVSQLRAAVNLGLSRNRIADIGWLAGIGSLWRLDIAHNRIADVGPLGSPWGLAWLRRHDNPVADPQAPIGFTHLRQVRVDAPSPSAPARPLTDGVYVPSRPLPRR